MKTLYPVNIKVGVTVGGKYCKEQHIETEWHTWDQDKLSTVADLFDNGFDVYYDFNNNDKAYIYDCFIGDYACKILFYGKPNDKIHNYNTKIMMEIPCPFPIEVELLLTEEQIYKARLFD